jgi:hypothetical protein
MLGIKYDHSTTFKIDGWLKNTIKKEKSPGSELDNESSTPGACQSEDNKYHTDHLIPCQESPIDPSFHPVKSQFRQ